MNIRYIKHNEIEPEDFAEEHNVIYNEPTFICGFPKETFLMLTGSYDAGKYLHTENIPKTIKTIRVPVPENIEAGVICYFKDTAKIDLYIPKGVYPVENIKRALLANIIKTLKLKKFNPIYRNNDLLIEVDSKFRKFCGFFHCELNEYDYYALPVSFKIDYELIESVYRLDTDKMLKKGDIKNISDVIIGLDEIGVIKPDDFLDLFVKNMSERFEWIINKQDV